MVLEERYIYWMNWKQKQGKIWVQCVQKLHIESLPKSLPQGPAQADQSTSNGMLWETLFTDSVFLQRPRMGLGKV